MIEPLEGNVVVKVEKNKETTDNGIILPDQETKPQDRGEVLAVHSSVEDIKKGDRIIFAPVGSVVVIDDDGKEFLMMKQGNLIGKLI